MAMESSLKIKIKKLSDSVVIPKYAHPGDAGMDVYAISKEKTDKYVEYGTGLVFEVPAGYVMLAFPRSSISKLDLIMANSVGVIDAGYRGELKFRFKQNGAMDYKIGDRIGQIIFIPFPVIEFEETQDLSESVRGDGGWGSTGKS